jgi:hypothetical protein
VIIASTGFTPPNPWPDSGGGVSGAGANSHADSAGNVVWSATDAHADSGGLAVGDLTDASSGGTAVQTKDHADSGGLGNGGYAHGDSSGVAVSTHAHADSSGNAGGESSHGDSGATASNQYAHADSSGNANGMQSHANTLGTAQADYSFASGLFCLAYLQGQKAFANGQFAVLGDAQTTFLILRNKTTDATPTQLFIDGSSLQFSPPTNAGQLLRISIIGLSSDHTTIARFVREALITNSGGSNVVIADSQTVGTDVNPGSWGGISIGASSGALTVTATGAASTNINWLAKIETVETIH